VPHPEPTPIYRFLHIDNLALILKRQALHAPKHAPKDGGAYKTIHKIGIQEERRRSPIPCGPGGVIHDYVSFYFGPRSPMLLQLHTGRVEGYRETQEPLIYLVSTAQAVSKRAAGFVFSDGHGIATYTDWYADLAQLDEVDWTAVNARYWADTVDDPDRQRRKQAEFLVYRSCPWDLIDEIVVFNDAMRDRVRAILAKFPAKLGKPVAVRPSLYY
jgi:hypothetical protein